MRNNLLIIIAVLVIVSGSVWAQEAEFSGANAYYANELFEDALFGYLELASNGDLSGELYYNIGNCYFKLGEFGAAILYYERARELIPDDEDLLGNIEIAQINVVDRITPIPEVIYVRYWNNMIKMMPVESWKMVVLISWFLAALLVSGLLLIRRLEFHRPIKYSLYLTVFVIIISGSVLLTISQRQSSGGQGVVLAKEVSVFASPSTTGTELFILHEGALFSIKRTMEDWFEIRLADGKVGWIPANTAEKV